jgi:hypothetical protein
VTAIRKALAAVMFLYGLWLFAGVAREIAAGAVEPGFVTPHKQMLALALVVAIGIAAALESRAKSSSARTQFTPEQAQYAADKVY